MTLIAGLDPGVNNIGLAFVRFPDQFIVANFFMIADTYSGFYESFKGLMSEWKPDKASIEKPYFTPMTIGKNMKTLELIGIQKLVFDELSIPHNVYSPTTIKKIVTGNGRAKKDEMVSAIHRLFPESEIENNHVADAAGIAYTDYIKTK